MIKKNLELILLLFILIFAGLIYLHKIDSIPSGIYVDEAVSAFDSFSLINTGADHFGKKFPISFRFFGAYTPGLFVYLNTIPIKIFGLNNFSIRLISVISTLVQLVFLFLINNFFTKNKSKYTNLLSILMISIVPWVVFNSRLGYEVTLAQTFFTVAIYYLLFSINNYKFLTLSSLFFSLSIHTAHTQKILVPMVIIFSFFLLKIWRYPKKIILYSFLILFVTQIPNLYLVRTKSFWIKTTSINKHFKSVINDVNYQFFQTVSPKTWFNHSPDIDLQHQIPESSPFYFWMFIPILIGFLRVVLKRKISIEIKLIIGLTLISLIPGILSGRFMSTQRLISLIIPFSVFLFLGNDFIIKKIKKKILIFPLFFFLVCYSLILLWRSYYVLLPVLYASAWNYGVDQVVQYIKLNPDKHYIIDNTRNSRLYILFLYHLKYNSNKFHEEIGKKWSTNYYQNTENISNVSFSNLEIRPVSEDDYKKINNIIIGDNLTIDDNILNEKCLEIIKIIQYPDLKNAYIFYKPKSVCK